MYNDRDHWKGELGEMFSDLYSNALSLVKFIHDAQLLNDWLRVWYLTYIQMFAGNISDGISDGKFSLSFQSKHSKSSKSNIFKEFTYSNC